MKHLGIILISEEANYNYLTPRLENAKSRITRRNGNTCTRALLNEEILHSQANHVLMSIMLDEEQIEEIQKLIYKALWRKKIVLMQSKNMADLSQWGR